jgi:hypothetical protein
MPTYGAYPRDEYGNVIALPMTFEATNDLVAIVQAMQWAEGCDLEVWYEGQRVGTVVRNNSAARCFIVDQPPSAGLASGNFT